MSVVLNKNNIKKKKSLILIGMNKKKMWRSPDLSLISTYKGKASFRISRNQWESQEEEAQKNPLGIGGHLETSGGIWELGCLW